MNTRIYAIWTTYDGIRTAIIDTQEELDEVKSECWDISWVDDWILFDWQRPNNGIMIKGGTIFYP